MKFMLTFLCVAGFAATARADLNDDTQVHTGQPVDGDGDGEVNPTLDPNDPAVGATGETARTAGSCSIANCMFCDDDTTCLTCEQGYALDAGACTACEISDCAVCDLGPATCDGCADGFRLVTSTVTPAAGTTANAFADAECAACTISGCGDCVVDSDGTETCDACATGYYMADDGGCSACGDNCLECAAVDSNGNVAGCLQCDDSYEPEIDGSCGLIGTDCGNNCDDCEEHNQCKACADGYSVQTFNNGQSTGCAACPPNCDSCADAEICDECSTGYILDDVSGSCATQEQVYANVCDCRTTVNNGCTCTGDEDTSKDGCCDVGGFCGGTDGVCATYNNNACNDFDNCAYCFGQSFCGSCDTGYYKTNGHPWGDCIAMPDNWDTDLCDTTTLYNDQCDCGCGGVDPECVEHKASGCTSDTDAGVYCDATGLCAECSLDGCAYCSNGDDSDTCLECADGYDLADDGTCTKCEIDGCSSCQAGVTFNTETGQIEDSINCKSCMDGYYSNIAAGTCTACDQDNCQMCSSTSCSQCEDGYSLDSASGTCNACSANCLQCSATSCNRCESGFDVDTSSGTCTDGCGDNCATCQKGGMCKICESGYYTGAGTNGKCVSCMDNCASCRDASSCSVCDEGYDFDTDEEKCVVPGVCLADVCDCRSDSEYADNNGCSCPESEESAKLGCCNKDCGLCSDHCADYTGEPCTDFDNCEYCYGQDYCMVCSDNFYQPDYHGDCVALPEGWDLDLCAISLLGNNQCDCECGGYDPDCEDWPADGCDDGQYCSTSGTCEDCTLAGCAHCSNGDGHLDGTCLECTDGHYMDDDGNCGDCSIEGCATCLLQAAANDAEEDTFSCKLCQDGYYANTDDLCSECTVDNCNACALDGTCEECSSGYASDGEGGCSGCIENCLDCTGDVTTCKSCDDGYELLTDETCAVSGDCGDNCLVCGAQDICKQCLNGFFKNGDSACEACMDNCGSCSGTDSCSDCESGYGWSEESSTCEAYSDADSYCDQQIRDGVFDEGTECECVGWQCTQVVVDSTLPTVFRR